MDLTKYGYGTYQINTPLFTARMKLRGLTQHELAVRSGLAQNTISQKINRLRATTCREAEIFADLLDLCEDEVPEYFKGISSGEPISLHIGNHATLVSRERDLIFAYRSASAEDRAAIDEIVSRYSTNAE